MPRREYDDDEYDDRYHDEYDDGEYQEDHEDYRRRADRTPSPPRQALRRDHSPVRLRVGPARRNTRPRTPSPSTTPSSAPLSAEGTSAAGEPRQRNSRIGHPYYTRSFRKDRPQSSVSSTTASRIDVAGRAPHRHTAASSLEGSSAPGRQRRSPDTRANYTGSPPRYSSPSRDETLEEKAQRIRDLMFHGAYDPTDSEFDAVQTVFSYRRNQASMQADTKLAAAAGTLHNWDDDDGVSGNRFAQMALDNDGRVDRHDRAPHAQIRYSPPEGARKGDDPRKGKFRRLKESPPDPLRTYKVPVNGFADEVDRRVPAAEREGTGVKANQGRIREKGDRRGR